MAEKKDKDKQRDKGKGEHREKHLARIKELLEIMKDNDLVELEIKNGDEKIFLKRSQPQPPAITTVPMVAPTVPIALTNSNAGQISPAPAGPAASEELVAIKSPLVGTLYSAPSPDSESYVEVGSLVNSTTVVCIIEAMKVMNEIKAETSGTIVEILVKNGEAVEYGQVLFRLKPD
ncbi:MAG TPA: acetyl-CoA carboxylase biotin carboxyl carrier protein [Sedimentisphaerales bacterium]|nr:acetyl-CoA carboxylase biotin carboxyl carrier protein [Sedimentisphaerales bacterium]